MDAAQTLAEHLNEIHASHDVVQQALRIYLAEQTEYLPIDDMRQQLQTATGSSTMVDEQLAALARSSADIEQGALVLLSDAWADPAQRDRVRAALAAANQSLPVVEAAILAVVVMYGMYLLATRGVQKETHVVRRAADGSLEETRDTTFANPAPWFGTIIGLFGRTGTSPDRPDEGR
jgi:hypothetical protein